MRNRLRGVSAELGESARAHRNAPTAAEERLWEAIRRRQVEGARFRRQHPLGTFILDFCCPEHRLVIEVDGPIHEGQEQEDEARTEYLKSYGYRVLRFTNVQVMNQLDDVVSEIQAAVLERNTPLPPERRGEGAGG